MTWRERPDGGAPARGSALDGALRLGTTLLQGDSLPEHPAYLLVG